MKTTKRILHLRAIIILFAFTILLLAPDIAEARGSFGGRGFGRSFGRRSFGRSAPSRSRSSFGRQRSMTSSPVRNTPSQRAATSFGGRRLNSSGDYTAKYGVPRRSQTFARTNAQGLPQNYAIHNYGGYGNGLMMGYMLGHTSWMWLMPFHPAFYYTKPYYADNPDGTVSVYPPTFDWGKLFFTILIVGAIVYIIYSIIRNKRRMKQGYYSQSSFG
ncbi:MAG: hypothetical protein A2X61_11790 [Ignavibacteria bacterium GWB2_35_12]|nr:MAG: hypothetical protein A2X61_11790 [Ignavibacteria bacterium GWB2_35_12]OGU96091.1 MAG: hypothetical protein A2220_14910 [Ignavibacteria bacterium RIFOXYA2_FULL_35_10]OGV24464.1 MAG: hypothetical protein A2475_12815 [Ignavibacteria bacterium RIFOXYC2_FULL_35_21]